MCRHFIGHESSLNNFFSPPPLKKENKSCLLATQSHKWNSHRKNGPIRTTITSLNCKVIYTKVEWVGMHFSCLHAFIQWHQARAGWIFHPSTSLGSFGSYKQAAPCMQARKTHNHLFYLGIDDFDWIDAARHLRKLDCSLAQPTCLCWQ